MHRKANFARLFAVNAVAAAPVFLAPVFLISVFLTPVFLTVAVASADSIAPANAPLSPAEAKAAAAKAVAADNAVNTAATALRKEFEAHLANGTAPLRTESNFFTQNNNPDITPKAIISALNRGYGSTAASIYVHWELLSGITGTVDDSMDSALVQVYRDAPTPALRPGLDPDQKAQFRQAVLQMKETDAVNINAEFEKSVQAWEPLVKPYTEYRDELIKKLPVNFELVRAQFRDAVQRASCGVDSDEAMGKAIENGRTWATGGTAKPEQLEELAGDVTSLLQEMGQTTARSDGSPLDESAVVSADSSDLQTEAYSRPRLPLQPPGTTGIPGNTGIYGTGTNGTTGINGTNSSKNAAKALEPLFPPRYFTEVAWNAKTKALEWKTGAAKFASKEELLDFRKTLVEQIEAARNKTNKAAS